MFKTVSRAAGLALLLAAAPLLTPTAEAAARQGHSASFAARGGGGAVAARASGGTARFAASFGGHSFVASAGSGSVARAKFVAVGDDRERRHRRYRTAGYAAAFVGVPLVTYGYVTRNTSCVWLRERYEDTGLRKWRLRYEACRDGDDD